MIPIPIFLPSDNNYAPFLAVAVLSILSNTNSPINFYILDSGITQENKEKICSMIKTNNIEFLKIDTVKYFKDFQTPAHLNLSAYNRFLIPLLKPNLEKILYIDSDTITLGNIENLFNIDLADNYIAAIAEDNANAKERINALKLNDKYFNAGVLVINNKKWIENNIVQALFDVATNYRDNLKWGDQDILNIVFNNKTKYLNKRFNFLTQNTPTPEDIIIRHFTTALKPWQIHPDLNADIIQNTSDFWHYAKKTPFYNEILAQIKYKDKTTLRVLKFITNKGISNA